MNLSGLNIMPEAERRKLLYEFNDTEATYPEDVTLQQLFEIQARRARERIALVSGNKTLTYERLNEEANRLARSLRERGVRPNDIVGILCSRSENMVIAILAVLKAGGAYMPIDPEYPLKRIHYMLEDSGAKLCLVESERNNIPLPVAYMGIEEERNRLSHESIPDPKRVNQPDDLAYIIYTSGSTGKPKGVMIEHRNVVRLFFNDRPLFDFHESDVWTLFHSFCFDFSVWEMYGALLFGGKLVIVPPEISRDPERMLELLRREKVTVLNQTPTAFYPLCKKETEPGRPADLNLRYVIFGGEKLLPMKLADWKQKYPRTKLINMYGITETTVHVTYKEIGPEEIRTNANSVGKPIPTLQVYILDEHQQPVPIGVEGEIYVGGAGVARGYVNRPELTKERFIPHPFEPGKRLYRSGDLARWNANGELEYFGRIDYQVKIRGYRIELGEITAQLLAIDGIEDAVVTVRKDDLAMDKLCAYYVASRKFDQKELRDHLRRRLPEYMLPHHFVPIDKVPMTSNNKVDLEALPVPGEQAGEADSANIVLPANEREQQMLAIWRQMLNRSDLGVTSDYFEHGGDSIRAIELIARLNRELDLKLEIADLYEYRTIRALCARKSATEAPSLDLTAVLQEQKRWKDWLNHDRYRSLLPPDVVELFPMSDIQQGMVFHYMRHEGVGIYHDQFVYKVSVPGLDKKKLSKAMEILAERHPMLRTGFFLTDFPVPVQFVRERIEVKVEEVTLSSDDPVCVEREITSFLERDRKRPFAIDKPPLWRLVLFCADRTAYLGFIFHHAILDGWSVATMMSELIQLLMERERRNISCPVR